MSYAVVLFLKEEKKTFSNCGMNHCIIGQMYDMNGILNCNFDESKTPTPIFFHNVILVLHVGEEVYIANI